MLDVLAQRTGGTRKSPAFSIFACESAQVSNRNTDLSVEKPTLRSRLRVAAGLSTLAIIAGYTVPLAAYLLLERQDILPTNALRGP